MPRKIIDLTSKEIGLWRVIGRALHPSRQAMWKCVCRGCNREFVRGSAQLRRDGATGCKECSDRLNGTAQAKRNSPHGRTAEIVAAVLDAGESMVSVAARYGVTKQRVHQIVAAERARREKDETA